MATQPKPATEYQQGQLAVQRERVDANRDIAYDRGLFSVYEGLLESLGEVRRESAEQLTKERVARIKAVGDYYKQVNGGTAAARLRALADLYKTDANLSAQLLKAGSTANPSILQEIQRQTSINWGDSVPAGSDKATTAWQIFYGTADMINGPALLATYERIAETYGDPEKAYLSFDDGLKRRSDIINGKIQRQRDAIDLAQGKIRQLSEMYDRGETPPDKMWDDFERMKSLLPGVADPEAIKRIQTEMEKAPTTDILPTLKPVEDLYLSKLKDVEGRLFSKENPEKAQQDDAYARWLSLPKTQWWAKENGFQVGQVIPLPDDPAEAEALKKQYPKAYFSQWGIYIPGPDDEKAMRFGERQLKTKPEAELFRLAGLGRNTGKTQAYVEFDVMGGPDQKRHGDGAWYFEETPDGGKVYLSPEDLAAKRKPAVQRVGRNGKERIVQMADGRYFYTTDGTNYQELDAATGQQRAARIPGGMKDVDPGTFPLPDGVAEYQGEGLPPGVQKTTTPPAGALETVRGLKDPPRPTDPLGSIAYVDEKGRRVVVPKEKLVGEVRTVSGGEDKRTLGEMAAGARAKAAERKEQKRIGENEDIGDPVKPGARKARAETTTAMRQVVKPLADKYLDENLRPVPSSDEEVAEAEVSARADTEQTKPQSVADGSAPVPVLKPGEADPRNLLKPPPGPNAGALPKGKIGTTTGSEVETPKATSATTSVPTATTGPTGAKSATDLFRQYRQKPETVETYGASYEGT